MKFVKIISVILLMCFVGSGLMMACSDSKENPGTNSAEQNTTPAPEGTKTEGLKEITVSFNIADSKIGKNIYTSAENYKYKGFDTSILSVVEQYLVVETDIYFSTFEDYPMFIETIGEHMAENGQEWIALKGTQFVDKDGNEINIKNLLKYANKAETDLTAEDIANKEYVEETYLIPSLKDHILTDNESFTLVLVGVKEEVVEDDAEQPETDENA